MTEKFSRPLLVAHVVGEAERNVHAVGRASQKGGAGRRILATATMLAVLAATTPAVAKTVAVSVSAKCGPWNTGVNHKLVFGDGSASSAKVIYGAKLIEGMLVEFDAEGSMQWIPGGASVGAKGDPSMMDDRSVTFLPSHFVSDKSVRLGMGGLVGAFVTADGEVVGKPFGIGTHYVATVPAGAAAISLGINDDILGDNLGGFQVRVTIPEPTVRVEPAEAQ